MECTVIVLKEQLVDHTSGEFLLLFCESKSLTAQDRLQGNGPETKTLLDITGRIED